MKVLYLQIKIIAIINQQIKMDQENGVFVQDQEELTKEVWEILLNKGENR